VPVSADQTRPVPGTPPAPDRVSPAPTPSPRQRFARLVTEVLSPAVLVATVLIVVAWHAAASPLGALLWGLVAAAAASFVPITYILRGVRRGRWTDRHVRVRRQRTWPLLVCLLSTLAGTVLLALVGAPRELVALIASMVAALLVALPLTMWARWKVSVHSLVAAGTVVAYTVVFGPWLVLTWPVAPLVGWSRVALADHTAAQVLGGAAVGALATGVLMPALTLAG
jgi:membrane-associated phospholipid phosphatase